MVRDWVSILTEKSLNLTKREGKGGNLVCGNINSISHIFHIGATDLILICDCSLVDFAF